MKVGEAIKLLRKVGFEQTHQVGSHKKFKKGTVVLTIVYHSKDSEQLSRKAIKQIKKILEDGRSKN